MKRKILTLLFTLVLTLPAATQPGFFAQYRANYFVSATGNDNNNGKTPWTPWQTITKVNATTFQPGEIVAFRRGDAFTGTINVTASGTSGKPITYTSYGTRPDKPKIYGSEPITGWTLHNGNIYKANFTTDIKKLFVDDVEMKLARLTNTGYNLLTTVTSNSVWKSNAPVQANGYYTGAQVILRSEAWMSENRVVTDYTNEVFTTNTATQAGLQTGEGILLMNKLEFLDSAGEWFYDTATDIVYLWTPNGDSPANYIVRGSVTDNGIDMNLKNYVTIKNLNVKQFNASGVKTSGVGNTTNHIIENCVIESCTNGISYSNTTNTSDIIRNNEIRNCTNYGIYTDNAGSITLSGNTISGTGMMDFWGFYGAHQAGNGMYIVQGSGIGKNTIKNNTILNTGYNGIYFGGLTDVLENYVYENNMVKADGAGIYTASPTSNGSLIENNVVDYSYGPINGSSLTRLEAFGIYLDENTLGVTVRGNSVLNSTGAAIYLHKPYNHTITGNTAYNNRYGFLSYNTVSGTTTVTQNKFITGATPETYEPRQLLARKGSTGAVNFNNNTYLNYLPASDVVFRFSDGTYKTFADWKTATSGDAASTYDGTDFISGEYGTLLYATNTAKTYYKNNAETDSIVSSITLPKYTSKYIRGKYLDCILDYNDETDPVISEFILPATSTDLTINITSITATGSATAYSITTVNTAPTLSATWKVFTDLTYTLSTYGTQTLYAWVRDAAGNISSSISASTTVYSTATLSAGLIAAYDFEETSGLLQDVSGNARHATSHDANITINQTGNPGKAYTFAGTAWNNARIIVNDNDILTPTDSLSIFIWLPELTTIDKAHSLIFKGETSNYEYKISITAANKVQFNLYQNGTGTTIQVTGSTVLQSGTRYFIECSAHNILLQNSMSISINNVSETLTLGGTTSITGVINGPGVLYIGGESILGAYLNGKISQILIYGRLLTNAEKQALYNNGSGRTKSTW